jgi:hypothetical protein
MSGGERRRVVLVALLIRPADLPIPDEPPTTSTSPVNLLPSGSAALEGALVVVTHDRSSMLLRLHLGGRRRAGPGVRGLRVGLARAERDGSPPRPRPGGEPAAQGDRLAALRPPARTSKPKPASTPRTR